MGKIVGKGRVGARDVQTLPDGTHAIEPGLYLRVRGKYRNFFARLTVAGRRRDYAIGSAADVPLAVAKARLVKLRADILEGRDPWSIKASRKREAAETVLTFGVYSKTAIDAIANARRWRSAKHQAQWYSTIQAYADPVLGDMPIRDITRDDVLRVLEPIWETKSETASRLRGRLEAIFDQAIYDGLHPGPNPAAWRGQLDRSLPPSSKVQRVRHREAMTMDEAREAVEYLQGSTYVSHQAILFGILTAGRVNEFLYADWSEIDLERAVWSCPRRKDGKTFPHRVPLSRQALAILESLPNRSGPLFPAPRAEFLSIDTCRVILQRIVKRKVTMHGCRSTFRDWAEEAGIDWRLAERSLMHTVGGEVERAYQRSDMLEQRRPVMQAWADALFE